MHSAYDNFIRAAIRHLPDTQADFLHLKKQLSAKFKIQTPTNANLRERYNYLLAQKKIRRSPKLEKLLLSRRVRTESGVAVVAVLTKSYPCPGQCLYCPTEKEMPKSYLSNEPAVMRAISAKFNPYAQVQSRLRSLELNGHQTDKVELIVMGGTFSALPKAYQQKFVAECFRACNDYPKRITCNAKRIVSDNLSGEQKRNEKAKHRIIGLTLETRPDYIDEKEIVNFRALGCTRVELGVQSIFDDVLRKNKRGHAVSETIRATKLLKDAGFKINYHIMPGLPGSSIKKDYKMFQELFSSQNFQPDMLKIYPTVVLKNSALYSLWKRGEYKPLTDHQFKKFIVKVKNEIIPPYVRIQRLIRDVPAASIIAGPIVSNLRQLIATESKCQCIRCREVGADFRIDEQIVLDRTEYATLGGREIFLQYVSPDKHKLFALLRLRLPDSSPLSHFIPALRGAALIREVHTYGKMTAIDTKDKKNPQHIGLGKKLMLEAEKIAREYGFQKIVVISGIGVRGYYRKLGYKLQDTYMAKGL
ncbi:tRNA uridine(34) 5-carboxymethylaminomethyl modification radical SAM/GNAT enzyme Elp3 [Patescibacteria group bacterium]|nr:MAG: tRNA uridine(34) 5-carboxymethylaminomethyl modification radical SAM/GNAT enzyme Elp3 [Patescibacteria group bacterium]